MTKILICGVKVPFSIGGQDVLVDSLKRALEEREYSVDVLELPFVVNAHEDTLSQLALWRSLDLRSVCGFEIDVVIATKFPSYFIRHPNKRLWLVHQMRSAFELHSGQYSDFSDSPLDQTVLEMLHQADKQAISECSSICTISKNVASRVKGYFNLNAKVVYPPLSEGSSYHSKEPENYILSVGRLLGIKRVDLLIKALPMVHEFMTLKVVGAPDDPAIMEYLQNEIAKHHLQHRVEFLGRVSKEKLLDLYARASLVYYAPYDEDYGYVAPEALASSKAVVSASDSGGVLEFVKHMETGLVVEPSTNSIADGINRLIEDKDLALRLGTSGRAFVETENLLTGWDSVISRLLS